MGGRIDERRADRGNVTQLTILTAFERALPSLSYVARRVGPS